MARRRLNWEKKALDATIRADELTGFKILPRTDNDLVWDIEMEGPEDTPYVGGVYKIELQFPSDYPFKPPYVLFVTKIWNPCIEVNRGGKGYRATGLTILQRWNPVYRIIDILLAVRYVLQEPLIGEFTNYEAGEQYKNEREKFNQKAETWKQLYA